MKSGTFLTLVLLAFGAGALAYEHVPAVADFFGAPAEGESPAATGSAKNGRKGKTAKARKRPAVPSAIPGSYIGEELSGKEWADTQALQKKLTQSILQRLKGTDKASVRAFIAEPANRLLLAQWFLAARENEVPAQEAADQRKNLTRDIEGRVPNIEKLKQRLSTTEGRQHDNLSKRLKSEQEALRILEVELASPRSMSEALASTPDAEAFVEQVTNNLDWMEQIVYSGECVRPGRAMGILAALAKDDKQLAYRKMQREIATATAVEWAKSGWRFDKALRRADFYIRSWEDDRLHTEFNTIPFWQRRIICGSKGDNGFGEVESLRWLQDNVNLPTEQYAGCCWQCAYRTNNLFGDSIHGPMYYNPYEFVFGNNYAHRVYDVGGVCGALSHYGAFAAIANGIPALTAGEPGHCAYVVFSKGKWTPGYSLSWKRGLHWQPWSGIQKYSSLHLATELFSAEQLKKTQESNALWTLAKLYATTGEHDKALASIAAAVDTQPCNFSAWRDYAFLLKDLMPGNKDAWKQLNKSICATLAPLSPEMTAELLKAHVYPGMQKAGISAADMQKAFGTFWKAVDSMGPDRWDVEALCGSQADVLKKLGGNPEESALALYGQILGLCSGKAAYAPVILSWGNGLAAGMKPEMQQKFLKATLSGLSKGGDMDVAARDGMLGQALAGAEKMRDRSSFQAIGKMLSENYRKNILPKWEPFPGKLASQGGMIYTSSSAHDDLPSHWGVLEPTGGRFHTGNEENAWVVVEMPKLVYVTGVVAISTAGHNVRRLHDMKVQYSESGKDDDWHEAGAFPAPSARAINRLDLKDSKPRARFIRIIRGGGKDFFHLNGIFVYGEQAA